MEAAEGAAGEDQPHNSASLEGLCHGLCHCGWGPVILLRIISGNNFNLHAADGESEVCPRSTATEPLWDSRLQIGCTINEELSIFPGLRCYQFKQLLMP